MQTGQRGVVPKPGTVIDIFLNSGWLEQLKKPLGGWLSTRFIVTREVPSQDDPDFPWIEAANLDYCSLTPDLGKRIKFSSGSAVHENAWHLGEVQLPDDFARKLDIFDKLEKAKSPGDIIAALDPSLPSGST